MTNKKINKMKSLWNKSRHCTFHENGQSIVAHDQPQYDPHAAHTIPGNFRDTQNDPGGTTDKIAHL